MSTFWKLYFFGALAYKLWGSVYAYSGGVGAFIALDLFYVGMFVALFGLAFQKRIMTRKVWRYGFVASLVFYLYEWIWIPLFLWRGAGITPEIVAHIKAYSLPLLPLIVAVYRYAWRSDVLWTGDVLEPSEPQGTVQWPPARIVLYVVALVWLVLLPLFEANSAHFGWGFFPLIASIVVVPVIALALLTDVVLSLLAVRRASSSDAAYPWMVPALGVLLLAGYAMALFLTLV